MAKTRTYSILKSKKQIQNLFQDGEQLFHQGIFCKFHVRQAPLDTPLQGIIHQQKYQNSIVRTETDRFDQDSHENTSQKRVLDVSYFVSVSKKIPTKVLRNRLKRVIRAHLDVVHEPFFKDLESRGYSAPALDIAWIANGKFLDFSYPERNAIMQNLLKRVLRMLAQNSSSKYQHPIV